MLKNIQLVGGGCAVAGLKERLYMEVKAVSEVGAEINI